ncbi:hypothetical protein J6590_082342 [Homalodisca vitripennis]|nr:hypothetical protein J6590_082342 [Homalodisca vitripennis]
MLLVAEEGILLMKELSNEDNARRNVVLKIVQTAEMALLPSEDWVMEGVEDHGKLETRMSAHSGFTTPINCMIVTTTYEHAQLGYSGVTDLHSSFLRIDTASSPRLWRGKYQTRQKKDKTTEP